MSYIKVYTGIDRVMDDGSVISIVGKEAQINEEDIAAWTHILEEWAKDWF